MKIRYGAKFVKEDFDILRRLAKKTKRSLASFIDEAIKMVIKKYAIQNKKRL